MRFRETFIAGAVLCTALAAVTNVHAAPKPKAAEKAATEKVKKIGLPVVSISGCVRQALACKYVANADGSRVSAAVKSEVSPLANLLFGWAIRQLPDATPIPANTDIVGVAATLRLPSLNCGGARV